MSSWKSGFVEVDGLRLHYTRTGSDGSRPPVVLAHGYTDDGLMLDAGRAGVGSRLRSDHGRCAQSWTIG